MGEEIQRAAIRRGIYARLLSIADTAAPRMCNINDPMEVEAIFRDEIERALNDLETGALTLGELNG